MKAHIHMAANYSYATTGNCQTHNMYKTTVYTMHLYLISYIHKKILHCKSVFQSLQERVGQIRSNSSQGRTNINNINIVPI